MSWVNFNFGFLKGAISACAVELESDMYSVLVTCVGVLIGTAVMRYVLDTYVIPWWIRRKVSRMCLFCAAGVACMHVCQNALLHRCTHT